VERLRLYCTKNFRQGALGTAPVDTPNRSLPEMPLKGGSRSIAVSRCGSDQLAMACQRACSTRRTTLPKGGHRSTTTPIACLNVRQARRRLNRFWYRV